MNEPELSPDEQIALLKVRLEEAQVANEKLKGDVAKAKAKEMTLLVSERKAVQLNGLRKFPVTMYKREWFKVFSMKDKILEFINAHDSELA